ncbi:MAG TPA: formylmethanofuran--tetrahydromethanopterin N-formyltransferase [Fimbriiglobus sp.]|jgi:formylmethanofuran--tetrahydromethanopterin N-formyltransferase
MAALFHVRGVEVVDTFAEAFPMTACALVVTAETIEWARIAGTAATGYAASVIGCDAEAGIDAELSPGQSPDGRPGVRILFFAFNRDSLEKAVVNRVAQCVLTCATTAVYGGLEITEKAIRVGGNLRYFGDGWQISKVIGDCRYWRIPTMDGEFLVVDKAGTTKGVAGGNLIILAETQAAALNGAMAAAKAARAVSGVILPFPGGVVRSGSKVGSKYKALKASTNEAFCPTLRGVVPGEIPDGVNAAYEIVIDGLIIEMVSTAMRAGLHAACRIPGVKRITAGNFGGKLGPHHFFLRDLLGDPEG